MIRKYVWMLVLFLIVLFGLIVNYLIWPNTHLSQLKIGLMTRAQVEKTIEELNQSSVQILINDDVKSVNYGDLGV